MSKAFEEINQARQNPNGAQDARKEAERFVQEEKEEDWFEF